MIHFLNRSSGRSMGKSLRMELAFISVGFDRGIEFIRVLLGNWGLPLPIIFLI